MFRNLELEDMVVNGEVEQWVRLNEVEELSEFEDWYWVSNFGRVKSVGGRKGDRILRQRDCRGYLQIGLTMLNGKRKQMYVHRLVCFAFVSGYENGLVCNHLDENSKNNHYNNLEWCTQKQNINYGTRTERTSKAVVGECVQTGKVIEFDSTQNAGRQGFSQGNVAEACRGRYNPNGKHGGTNVYRGYRWKFKESA